MLREIVLDTETTGLSIKDGNQLIEIGCVELINKSPSGKYFHTYLKPNCRISEEAFRVHGISEQFLMDKPKFSDKVHEFLNFIGNSALVIHNAVFDMQFINHELALMGLPLITKDRVVDTLLLARKKYPGSPVSLDALCRRFSIDLEIREKHGAMTDAELLSVVYIMMLGKLQSEINFNDNALDNDTFYDNLYSKSSNRKRRKFKSKQTELELHKKLTDKLNGNFF